MTRTASLCPGALLHFWCESCQPAPADFPGKLSCIPTRVALASVTETRPGLWLYAGGLKEVTLGHTGSEQCEFSPWCSMYLTSREQLFLSKRVYAHTRMHRLRKAPGTLRTLCIHSTTQWQPQAPVCTSEPNSCCAKVYQVIRYEIPKRGDTRNTWSLDVEPDSYVPPGARNTWEPSV